MLVVEKFPGSNTREVTAGLEKAMQALQPGLPGLAVDTTAYRPASFIDAALDNVGRALVVGLLLVILGLAFLLLAWRVAVLSVVSMVLSMTAAVTVLQVRGATFNVMVLAGLVLALGVVVDEAIVTSQHIACRLKSRHEAPAESVAVDAAVDVRRPLLPATLGGVLGFGGTKVSEKEKATLSDIAKALGIAA